mgnify:CR=1 FL=1
MADENTIILKLKVEEAQAKVSIKKLKEEIKVVGNFTDEYRLKVAKLNLEEQKLVHTRQKLSHATGQLIGDGKKGLTGVSNATGGATSATLELGRAISDAPYGIRGVANNLSQFASQFSFMSNKVDETTGKVVGFNGAIKNLGKAIRANAVLLAIQLVIAALDHFAGSTKKAQAETESLTKVFGAQTTKLMVLKSALDDSNVSLEDKTELVKKANKEFKDLNIELDDNGNLTDASRLAIDKHSIALVKNAKAKAIANLITKEMNNQAKLEAEETGSQLGYFETLYQALSAKVIGTSAAVSNAMKVDGDKRNNEIEKSEKRVKKFLKMLKENGADLAKSLLNDVKDDNKDAKISPFKTKEALDLDVKNNLSAIEKLQRKTELINLKTEEKNYINSIESEEGKLAYKEFYAEKRLELELKYELKAIEAKENAEKESVRKKATRRIKELEDDLSKYKKNLKDKGIADTAAGKQSIAKATKEVEEKVALTTTEAERTVQQITEKYSSLFPFWTQMADARRAALGVESEDKEVKEIDKISEFIGNYKTLMSGLTDFIDGEFERELTIEQNKTNVLNKQLNDRLLNENLSKDQRKSIQNEIAQNDENLRIKQDAIARKKFKTAKAFAISMAVADTYLAGVKVLADPSFIGRPFSRGIAMAATIASGLASVAAISRQKFQSTSANTPVNVGSGGASGGASASERAEPSFNIVGRSNDNLLINAIQAQFGKPLKAYVVSRDVTTQQQLDGIIVGQAGT